MNKPTRAEQIAKGINDHEAASVIAVGDPGWEGVWIHGPQFNWVTIALLNKRHPEMFSGFSKEIDPKSEHFRLTPFGLKVRRILIDRRQAAAMGRR